MAYNTSILNIARAPEAKDGRNKGGRREALLASTILAMASALVAPALISPAQAQVALPTNGQVTAGQATIENPSDSSLKVTQSSDKAIIDWSNFSIGAGGTVQFNNGNGATLNRVTGANISSIDGVLSATGSVYLINPNGVIIGKGGVVNVGGNFVGSTLNVSNADFLKGGSLTFDGLSGASVINFGKVGSLGGDVALIANVVDNKGDISAAKGTVGLIAGQSVLMRDSSVDGGKFLILRGGAGASVSHSGLITATAAELAAEGGSVYALAGNTDNIERATDVVESGGKLYLATGAKTGGNITVGADAVIDASSATGEGGSIKVIADMTTGSLLFQGKALAKGGYGAKGGFVETSGAYVNFNGARIDTTAEGGKTGLWLTDPYDLTVDASAASTIQTNLATTNVTLQTTNSGTSGPGIANAAGSGDITINSAISWSSGNTLTLDAYRGININAALTVSGAGGVSLITNNGGTGGDYSFGLSSSGFAGKLSFTGTPGSGQSLSLNGDNYNLLYSMSDIAGISGSSDRYALANDLVAGTYSDSVVGTFAGSFTGLGHTLNGLTINGTSTLNTGLIGESSGTVRDIGIVGGSINNNVMDSHNTGALLGINNGGVVQNAYSTATVNGLNGGQYIGGLIGYSVNATIKDSFAKGAVAGVYDLGGLIGYADNSIVTNSFSTGSVNGTTGIGGLIGRSFGSTIANAYASGNIDGSNINSIGGLVGELSSGSVSNSHASGDVTSSYGNSIGGLVGNLNSGASLTNSYATGAVTGTDQIGGLVGYLQGTLSQSYATGAVTGGYDIGGLVGLANSATLNTSYATGNVNASMGSGNTGGLIGRSQASTIDDVYATGAASGNFIAEGIGGLIGHLDATSSLSRAYATGMVTVNSYNNAPGGAVGVAQSGASISNVYYDYQTSGMAAGVQSDGTQGLSTAALQGTLPTGFASPTWGTAAGYYPFFGGSAPAMKVSGFAYNSNGSAAVGGTVGVYTGGNLLTGSTVTTGANGYYYYTVPVGTVAPSTPLGAALTLSGDTTASGLTYTDTPIFTGIDVTDLDITSGIFKVNTIQTDYVTLRNNMMATFGTGTYASLLSDIGSAERRIFAATSFNINTPISVPGKILIQANNGDLIIAGGGVTSGASGDAIILAANGSFINYGGYNVGSLNGGRWLIYSQANNNPTGVPTPVVPGSLYTNGKSYYNDAFNFTTSTFASAPGAGNRFVYGYAPTLTVSPTTQSVVYNGAVQTDTYAASGYLIAQDQIADSLTGTISGLTASGKNVGAYSLTASGTLVSDLNYGITYGSGTLTITPAALTASLIGNTTKTYDGNDSATLLGSNYSLAGLIGTDAVTLSSTSATYNNKNAGTAKTVTASGLSLSGLDAGNYTVNSTAAANIGTIDKAALTATLTGTTTKTYDGTIAATLAGSNYSLGGVIGTDAVTVSGTATYDNKNAGSAKTVTSTGLALGGLDGGNYTVNTSASANIGVIDKASLTIAAATDTKVYDGTNVSTAAPSTSGLATGDTVTGLTQTFDSKDAGARTLTVNGTYTINDGNGGNNYVVTTGALTTAGTITKAALTASLIGNTTKTYDGTNAATLIGSNYALTGLIGTDAVTVSGTSAAYNNKNAGTGKLVTATGLSLSGLDAGNYTVSSTASGNIGTIDKAALTASLIGNTTKTYDGTTTATLIGSNYSLAGLIGTDAVTVSGTAAYGNKNAGTAKSVTATGLALAGLDAGNYTVNTSASGNIGTINKASLTIAAATDTKVYDGTNTSTAAPSTSGLATGDTVTGLTQTFDSKNAGARTITVNGTYTINDGNGGNNYVVTTGALTTTGTITAKALTAALIGNTTKTYDGTTAATLIGSNYSLTGLIGTDAVTASSTSATYNNKNAGTAKTVTASGLSLSGLDAGNYTVSGTASGNIGTINKATLTLTAATSTKTYNGTTASSGTATAGGLIAGDTVTGLTQTFDSKNAGSRTLNVTGYTVNDGNSGGNYAVTLVSAAGTINKAALTAALTGTVSKTYDGTTTATLSGTNYALTGLIGTDSVSVTSTAAYADKNAGTGKAVTATGLTLGGTDGGNYTVNASASANIGTITKASLTVTGDTKTKVQGATEPALTYSVTTGTLFSGDSLTGSLTRAVGETPGTYDITQGTLAASSNYNLTYVKGAFKITPTALLTTLTLTPATAAENLQAPAEVEAPTDATPCVSSDKCLSHPYPTNQVISSTIRFASK